MSKDEMIKELRALQKRMLELEQKINRIDDDDAAPDAAVSESQAEEAEPVVVAETEDTVDEQTESREEDEDLLTAGYDKKGDQWFFYPRQDGHLQPKNRRLHPGALQHELA